MAHTHKPQNRPSRLPPVVQGIVSVLLLLSLISGIFTWWGRHLQEVNGKSPVWLHFMFVLHGCLYPFICILYGFIIRHHSWVSWQIRANLITGGLMLLVLGGLILSGVGMHYIGSEKISGYVTVAHKVFGVGLPLVVASHWILALRWAKKVVEMPK